MEFPPFALLDFLETHFRPGIHNLATSHFHGPPVEPPSADLNLAFGDPRVRTEVAALHGVAEAQVLITAGASEANFLLAATLLRRGDRCLIETPGFPPLRGLPQGFGARTIAVERRPADGFALDPEAVRAALPARLALFTNLHNPSGALTPREVLVELAAEFAARDALLVVDEVFLPLTEEPTLAGTPGTAITGSLSKSWGGTGTRVGWIIADPRLIERLAHLKRWSNPGHGAAGEAAGLAMLAQREVRLRAARRRAAEGAQAVAAVCRRHGWEWYPTHGHYGFPRAGGDTLALAHTLAERGVLLTPGDYFGLPGHLRLGWGVPAHQLAAALEALDAALAALNPNGGARG